MLVVQESVSQTQSNRRAKWLISARWRIAALLCALQGFVLLGLTGQGAVAAESHAIANMPAAATAQVHNGPSLPSCRELK